MNKILIFFLTIFVMSILSANAQEEKNNSPFMEFETLVYDFGEVFQGDDTQAEFKFTNKGKEPLIISDAKASCGCTVPEWPKNPFLPGESGTIKVKYNSNILGKINKQVTILSNANNSPTMLRVEGNVSNKPPEIMPLQPEFNQPIPK